MKENLLCIELAASWKWWVESDVTPSVCVVLQILVLTYFWENNDGSVFSVGVQCLLFWTPLCLGVHTYNYTDSPHSNLLYFPQFLYIIRPMYGKFNLVVTAFLTEDGQEVVLTGWGSDPLAAFWQALWPLWEGVALVPCEEGDSVRRDPYSTPDSW